MQDFSDTWLKPSEVAELVGITKRAINKKIKKFTYRLRACGAGYEILLSSLPAAAVAKYIEKNGELEKLSDRGEVEVDELHPKQKEIALARFDLLKTWINYRENCGKNKTEADNDFEQLYNEFNTYPKLKEKLGKTSVKTLYNWSNTPGWTNDYTKLAPQFNYGGARTTLPSHHANILLNYVKHPNALKVSEMIRAAKAEMIDAGIHDLYGDSTYRQWIENWKRKNYDEWLLTRHGEKALNDKNIPDCLRDKERLEVGDLLIIDGHVNNYEIINPVTGKPKRMMTVAVYDYYSDVPLGWEIMPTESTWAIASALRRALLRLGQSITGGTEFALKGRVINIDNGRAEKSKWFLGDLKNSGIQGLFYKVFERVLISQAYHGQSKTIERFFGTMAELERSMISYTGTSIESKPARMMRNEKFLKAVYEKMTGGITMTMDQAHMLTAVWLDTYAGRKHQDGAHKGYSPKGMFESSVKRLIEQSDFTERLISRNELNYLMMEEQIKTLYKNGIKFNGEYYWTDRFYFMEKGEGKFNFNIKYDRSALNSIYVYDENGKLIGEAVKKVRTHPLAEFMGTEDEIEEYNRQMQHKGALRRLTLNLAKDHFEREITPQLPATTQMIIDSAEAKKVKEITAGEKPKLILKNGTDDIDWLNEPVPESMEEEDEDYF